MSAPLVVNTSDGTCWMRRAVTRGGEALYAPEGVCSCPEFVMATLAELAEHGIVGSADVLPVPVGPERSPLEKALDDLAGANLSLWEEERAYERLRVALESAKRGRREARARVADLEQQLAAKDRPVAEDPIAYTLPEKATATGACNVCGSVPEEWCPDCAACRKGCFGGNDDNPCTHPNASWAKAEEDVTPQVTKLRSLLAGQRAAVEDPHDSPLHHDYRIGRDLPMGGAS